MTEPGTPPRPVFVDKGRRRTPAEQTRAEQVRAEALAGASAQSPPARSAEAAAAGPVWNGAAIALLAGGVVMALLGLVVLLSATNLFVGILAGAVFTSGMAWVAGFLVTRVR